MVVFVGDQFFVIMLETNSSGRSPSLVVETHNSSGNSDDMQATPPPAKKQNIT